jgi:alginate O-acetyltransferase complex protein AlgI
MLFSSLVFFVFWPICFVVWFLAPESKRIWVLILGSLIFYGYWNYYYTLLPLLLTLLAFVIVRFGVQGKYNKKIFLFLGIFLLISPLIYFKYSNFIFATEVTDYELPLGISFITFTLIAYVIDVAKGEYKTKEGLKNLSAYILFFPQLIAGPILRPKNLLPQLKKYSLKQDLNFSLGILFFCIGLLKKIMIADTLSTLVDPVYLDPSSASLTEFLKAFYGFSAQIYFDFSGYTDMAIGIALVFGIRLPINFQSPYLAQSVRDFWRNWHMTLSQWFRDYIYIPLGGNHFGYVRTAFNLILTMTLCGIWHGSGWNFIVWGFVHGLLVSISRKPTDKIFFFHRTFRIFITFHVVSFLWVLFRADSLSHAINFYLLFLDSIFLNELSNSLVNILITFFFIISFLLFHKYDSYKYIERLNAKLNLTQKICFFLLSIVLVVVFSSGSSGDFIYFDF